MVVVLPGWKFDAAAFKLWHYLACGRSLKKASLPVLDSAGDAGPWHSVNFGDVLEFRHKEKDGGAHGTYAPCFVLFCIYFDCILMVWRFFVYGLANVLASIFDLDGMTKMTARA